MSQHTVKAEARLIIDRLPDDASWKDLIYELVVRSELEAALSEGRGEPVGVGGSYEDTGVAH